IPRPRNAFILFRCDFVRQKKIPMSVEKDHRNISRIVGKIWQQMTDSEKEPWTQMAEMEKMEHFRKHPGYTF
ncbi:high mobility group box domain-containing protein, partial [Gymnopilus junonius]